MKIHQSTSLLLESIAREVHSYFKMRTFIVFLALFGAALSSPHRGLYYNFQIHNKLTFLVSEFSLRYLLIFEDQILISEKKFSDELLRQFEEVD